MHVSHAQPLIHFPGLTNKVHENASFTLRPSTINARTYSALLPFSADYFLSPPAAHWLKWDERDHCFSGRVPASQADGARRMDCYTILIEVTARVTKHFHGDIGLERVIRACIPLTVKRSPEVCRVGRSFGREIEWEDLSTSITEAEGGDGGRLTVIENPISSSKSSKRYARPLLAYSGDIETMTGKPGEGKVAGRFRRIRVFAGTLLP